MKIITRIGTKFRQKKREREMVIEIAQFNCRNFTHTHFDFIATEHKQNTFLRKEQKKSSPSILTF